MIRQYLKETLKEVECQNFITIDMVAYTLARCERASITSATFLVEEFPKLKVQVADCLAQDTSKLSKEMVMLEMSMEMNKSSYLGKVCDLMIRLVRR